MKKGGTGRGGVLRVYKIQSVARERKKEKKEKIGRGKGGGGGKNSSGYFQVGYFRVRPIK